MDPDKESGEHPEVDSDSYEDVDSDSYTDIDSDTDTDPDKQLKKLLAGKERYKAINGSIQYLKRWNLSRETTFILDVLDEGKIVYPDKGPSIMKKLVDKTNLFYKQINFSLLIKELYPSYRKSTLALKEDLKEMIWQKLRFRTKKGSQAEEVIRVDSDANAEEIRKKLVVFTCLDAALNTRLLKTFISECDVNKELNLNFLIIMMFLINEGADPFEPSGGRDQPQTSAFFSSMNKFVPHLSKELMPSFTMYVESALNKWNISNTDECTLNEVIKTVPFFKRELFIVDSLHFPFITNVFVKNCLRMIQEKPALRDHVDIEGKTPLHHIMGKLSENNLWQKIPDLGEGTDSMSHLITEMASEMNVNHHDNDQVTPYSWILLWQHMISLKNTSAQPDLPKVIEEIDQHFQEKGASKEGPSPGFSYSRHYSRIEEKILELTKANIEQQKNEIFEILDEGELIYPPEGPSILKHLVEKTNNLYKEAAFGQLIKALYPSYQKSSLASKEDLKEIIWLNLRYRVAPHARYRKVNRVNSDSEKEEYKEKLKVFFDLDAMLMTRLLKNFISECDINREWNSNFLQLMMYLIIMGRPDLFKTSVGDEPQTAPFFCFMNKFVPHLTKKLMFSFRVFLEISLDMLNITETDECVLNDVLNAVPFFERELFEHDSTHLSCITDVFVKNCLRMIQEKPALRDHVDIEGKTPLHNIMGKLSENNLWQKIPDLGEGTDCMSHLITEMASEMNVNHHDNDQVTPYSRILLWQHKIALKNTSAQPDLPKVIEEIDQHFQEKGASKEGPSPGLSYSRRYSRIEEKILELTTENIEQWKSEIVENLYDGELLYPQDGPSILKHLVEKTDDLYKEASFAQLIKALHPSYQESILAQKEDLTESIWQSFGFSEMESLKIDSDTKAKNLITKIKIFIPLDPRLSTRLFLHLYQCDVHTGWNSHVLEVLASLISEGADPFEPSGGGDELQTTTFFSMMSKFLPHVSERLVPGFKASLEKALNKLTAATLDESTLNDVIKTVPLFEREHFRSSIMDVYVKHCLRMNQEKPSLHDHVDEEGKTPLHNLMERLSLTDLVKDLSDNLWNLISEMISEENVNLADTNQVTPFSWFLWWKIDEMDKSTVTEKFLEKGANRVDAYQGVKYIWLLENYVTYCNLNTEWNSHFFWLLAFLIREGEDPFEEKEREKAPQNTAFKSFQDRYYFLSESTTQKIFSFLEETFRAFELQDTNDDVLLDSKDHLSIREKIFRNFLECFEKDPTFCEDVKSEKMPAYCNLVGKLNMNHFWKSEPNSGNGSLWNCISQLIMMLPFCGKDENPKKPWLRWWETVEELRTLDVLDSRELQKKIDDMDVYFHTPILQPAMRQIHNDPLELCVRDTTFQAQLEQRELWLTGIRKKSREVDSKLRDRDRLQQKLIEKILKLTLPNIQLETTNIAEGLHNKSYEYGYNIIHPQEGPSIISKLVEKAENLHKDPSFQQSLKELYLRYQQSGLYQKECLAEIICQDLKKKWSKWPKALTWMDPKFIERMKFWHSVCIKSEMFPERLMYIFIDTCGLNKVWNSDNVDFLTSVLSYPADPFQELEMGPLSCSFTLFLDRFDFQQLELLELSDHFDFLQHELLEQSVNFFDTARGNWGVHKNPFVEPDSSNTSEGILSEVILTAADVIFTGHARSLSQDDSARLSHIKELIWKICLKIIKSKSSLCNHVDGDGRTPIHHLLERLLIDGLWKRIPTFCSGKDILWDLMEQLVTEKNVNIKDKDQVTPFNWITLWQDQLKVEKVSVTQKLTQKIEDIKLIFQKQGARQAEEPVSLTLYHKIGRSIKKLVASKETKALDDVKEIPDFLEDGGCFHPTQVSSMIKALIDETDRLCHEPFFAQLIKALCQSIWNSSQSGKENLINRIWQQLRKDNTRIDTKTKALDIINKLKIFIPLESNLSTRFFELFIKDCDIHKERNEHFIEVMQFLIKEGADAFEFCKMGEEPQTTVCNLLLEKFSFNLSDTLEASILTLLQEAFGNSNKRENMLTHVIMKVPSSILKRDSRYLFDVKERLVYHCMEVIDNNPAVCDQVDDEGRTPLHLLIEKLVIGGLWKRMPKLVEGTDSLWNLLLRLITYKNVGKKDTNLAVPETWINLWLESTTVLDEQERQSLTENIAKVKKGLQDKGTFKGDAHHGLNKLREREMEEHLKGLMKLKELVDEQVKRTSRTSVEIIAACEREVQMDLLRIRDLKSQGFGECLKGLPKTEDFRDFAEEHLLIRNEKILDMSEDILKVMINKDNAQEIYDSFLKWKREREEKIYKINHYALFDTLKCCLDCGAVPVKGHITEMSLVTVDQCTNPKALLAVVTMMGHLIEAYRKKGNTEPIEIYLNQLQGQWEMKEDLRNAAGAVIRAAYLTLNDCAKSKSVINTLLFISNGDCDKDGIKKSFQEAENLLQEEMAEEKDPPFVKWLHEEKGAREKSEEDLREKLAKRNDNWFRRNMLHLAAIFCHDEEILNCIPADLVERQIDARDIHGSTPLHIAYLYGNASAIRFLKAHNAKEVADYFGRTPESLQAFHLDPDKDYKSTCKKIMNTESSVLKTMKTMLVLPVKESEIMKKDFEKLLLKMVAADGLLDAEPVLAGSVGERLKVGRYDEFDWQICIQRKSKPHEWEFFACKKIHEHLVRQLAEASVDGMTLRCIEVTNPWTFIWEGEGSHNGKEISVDVVPIAVVDKNTKESERQKIIINNAPPHQKIEHLKWKELERRPRWTNTVCRHEWDILHSIPTGCRMGILISKAFMEALERASDKKPNMQKNPITSYWLKNSLFWILSGETPKHIEEDHGNIIEKRYSSCSHKQNFKAEKADWTTEEHLKENAQDGRLWAERIFDVLQFVAREYSKILGSFLGDLSRFVTHDLRTYEVVDILETTEKCLGRLRSEVFFSDNAIASSESQEVRLKKRWDVAKEEKEEASETESQEVRLKKRWDVAKEEKEEASETAIREDRTRSRVEEVLQRLKKKATPGPGERLLHKEKTGLIKCEYGTHSGDMTTESNQGWKGNEKVEEPTYQDEERNINSKQQPRLAHVMKHRNTKEETVKKAMKSAMPEMETKRKNKLMFRKTLHYQQLKKNYTQDTPVGHSFPSSDELQRTDVPNTQQLEGYNPQDVLDGGELDITTMDMFALLCGLPTPSALHLESISPTGITTQVAPDESATAIHYISNHYVVSNQRKGKIYVYDSLDNPLRVEQLLPQLRCLYQIGTDTSNIEYIVPESQGLTSDCGLFAAAHATMLIHGIDPETVILDRLLLRIHLHHCLKNEHIQLFPVV